MTEEICFGEDYIGQFDSNAFVEKYYDTNVERSDREAFVLTKLHEFYTKTTHFPPDSASILEFGGGPTVSHLISAAPFASRIVLADYSPAALKTTNEWKKATPTSAETHWTAFFQYVIRNLEKNHKDDALEQRASEVKVKLSCTPCNILDEKPLGKDDYDNYFDVVSSSFCLEVACPTNDRFISSVQKLAKLLKGSGSWFVLNCVLGERRYPVGEKMFFTLPLTEDLVKEALDKAGFRLINFDKISLIRKEKGAIAACHAVGQLI
ncbi:nicotinamide N-methyltransferase-like [Oscarella lobularis]|uniref:nicotinamide N-methyltransferase-like n=1 Tax=Oscarella lobularis TaxID=121494 RepID=UPI003313F162